jgi:hypothetical protein
MDGQEFASVKNQSKIFSEMESAYARPPAIPSLVDLTKGLLAARRAAPSLNPQNC